MVGVVSALPVSSLPTVTGSVSRRSVCNYSCRVFGARSGQPLHCVRCDWNVYGMSFYLHFDDMEYSYSFFLAAILIGNGSSKRVSSSAGRLLRDDDGGLFRSGPVWIRKKSKHDFPLLSYANWVAGIWIWNWILSWVILIWENWGKDSFCWIEWLTLALNGAFKISYWGWIMHNYNLQQAVKSQPPRLTVHPKS